MTAESHGGAITSILTETRVFPPPPAFAREALVSSLEEYQALWDRAKDDPEGFWGELASEELRKGFLKLKRTVQERMSLKDPNELGRIAELVNSKSISSSIDFFFFSEGHESWVSPDLRLERGDFRTVDVARKRIFGEPVIPGLPRELHRGKYESVVKCLNGRLMVPYTYAVSRALDLPLVHSTNQRGPSGESSTRMPISSMRFRISSHQRVLT